MDRRTRTLVVVGLAMVLASVASYGVYYTLQNRPVVRVPIAERFTVVAAQPVSVGVVLSKEMVKLAAWPADSPVTGGFATVEEVVGRGLTAGLVENEPVIESKLAPKGSGGGLPPTIPPGMRAMSVKVNDVIGVAGFALPGTRVDVVVMMRQDGNREGISRTVLSNIQVLAVGTQYDVEKSKDGAAIPAQVVTLVLTPEDGERLVLASTQGQVVLALRNPLDVTPTETRGVRVSGLLAGLGPEPVRVVPRGQPARMVTPLAPPAPKPYEVEMYRGADKKTEIIKDPVKAVAAGAGS